MSHDSASSRILVVSSSLPQVFRFVDRIKVEASPPSTSANLSDSYSDRTDGDKKIPWTIVNKYYTADVHFEARELKAWSSLLADGVPAVIFLWAQGEPYKDHARYLSKELANHDPEVSLAVRVQGAAPPIPDEDEDLDAFLSSLGFEFIDAGHSRSVDADTLSTGVPGLPRVIDALSTIMWPTMVQSQSTSNRKSKARELLDWAREEEENDGLRVLVADSDDSGHSDIDVDPESTVYSFSNPMLKPPGAVGITDKKSRMQREMEELERWLEDEEVLRAGEDPWMNVSTTGGGLGAQTFTEPLWKSTSPKGTETPHAASWTTQPSGFDDDFTVFVSAPAVSTSTPDLPSGRSTPDTSFDSDRLDPLHTGVSYRSLGSVSDFGGSKTEDEDDVDLPSEAEIQAASSRIFGSSATRPPPLNRTSTARPISPSLPTATPSTSFAQSDAHTSGEEESEDEYEVGNFDLSRVLSALQNMKEEIAGMDDETERRRAAARAALGLVYGLERQGDGDGESGPV